MALALATAAYGLYKVGSGLVKEGKAKKEAALLNKTRPQYSVNPNVQNEVSLAQSELSNGMGADATRAYQEGTDRDLSTTLDALLKGGGSPNNIAQTFDDSEAGRQKLALMSDNLRLNQVNNLVSAYRNQTGEQDKAFLYNIDAPWKDKTQANAIARQNAANEVSSGIDTTIGAAGSYFGAQKQNNLYDKYFGKNSTTDNYSPTHVPDLVRNNSLVPINSSTSTMNNMQTIDFNAQPSINTIQFPNNSLVKYNLPQNGF